MNDQLLNTLRPIVEATRTSGFLFANPKSPVIRALAKDGLIEGNENAIDPSDAQKIAFRSTSAADAHMPAAAPAPVTWTAPAPAPAPFAAPGNPAAAPAASLTPTEGVPVTQVPAKRRGGAPKGPRVAPVVSLSGRAQLPTVTAKGRTPRGEIYPFATLEAPDATGHDSFFVAATDAMPNPHISVRSSVTMANKKHAPKAFKIFQVEGGAQIYRVK